MKRNYRVTSEYGSPIACSHIADEMTKTQRLRIMQKELSVELLRHATIGDLAEIYDTSPARLSRQHIRD